MLNLYILRVPRLSPEVLDILLAGTGRGKHDNEAYVYVLESRGLHPISTGCDQLNTIVGATMLNHGGWSTIYTTITHGP